MQTISDQLNSCSELISRLHDQLQQFANLTATSSLWNDIKADALNISTILELRISDFVARKNSEAREIITSAEATVTEYQANLENLIGGTYSMAIELKDAALDSIKNIMKPFEKANATAMKSAKKIKSEAILMKEEVATSVNRIIATLSTSADQIVNGFRNIDKQAATPTSDEGNIFDFDFIIGNINEIKRSLRSVSSAINGARDLVNRDVRDLLRAVTDIVYPESWVREYKNVTSQMALLESKYKYQASKPDLNEESVKSSANSLRTSSSQELGKTNINEQANSVSAGSTGNILSKVIDVIAIKDMLIEQFLSKLSSPSHTIRLYKYQKVIYLAPIPTQIGPIVVSCTIDFEANIQLSIALSPRKLGASIAPEAMAGFYASAGWYAIVIEIEAMVGARLSARPPFEMAMQKGVKGITVTGDFNYLATGEAGLYIKYLIVEIWWYCYDVPYFCYPRCSSKRCTWHCVYITICIPIPIRIYWSPPRLLLGGGINYSGQQRLLTATL